MSKKYFKGKEYEIVDEEGNLYAFINDYGNVEYMYKDIFSDTKEQSLERWKIFAITEVNYFHDIKFGKQDTDICIKKLYEETSELLQELEHYFVNPDNLDRIKDEYADVIQSGAGLFNLKETMEKNFQKIGSRIYPDNFKHKEIENENNKDNNA